MPIQLGAAVSIQDRPVNLGVFAMSNDNVDVVLSAPEARQQGFKIGDRMIPLPFVADVFFISEYNRCKRIGEIERIDDLLGCCGIPCENGRLTGLGPA